MTGIFGIMGRSPARKHARKNGLPGIPASLREMQTASVQKASGLVDKRQMRPEPARILPRRFRTTILYYHKLPEINFQAAILIKKDRGGRELPRPFNCRDIPRLTLKRRRPDLS
jgi:hypothetical protein